MRTERQKALARWNRKIRKLQKWRREQNILRDAVRRLSDEPEPFRHVVRTAPGTLDAILEGTPVYLNNDKVIVATRPRPTARPFGTILSIDKINGVVMVETPGNSRIFTYDYVSGSAP